MPAAPSDWQLSITAGPIIDGVLLSCLLTSAVLRLQCHNLTSAVLKCTRHAIYSAGPLATQRRLSP